MWGRYLYQVKLKIVNKHWPHIGITGGHDTHALRLRSYGDWSLVSADNSILIPSIIMG